MAGNGEISIGISVSHYHDIIYQVIQSKIFLLIQMIVHTKILLVTLDFRKLTQVVTSLNLIFDVLLQ